MLLLASMSFAIFATVTAVTMPGPLLVDMAAALETSVPVVGQLVTAAASTWALTAIVVGPFSDAYGRRPILLLGVCLLAMGSLGIGLAPSFALVAAFSVLLGVGGGMVPPTCIALVGDLLPEERQPKSIAILIATPGVSSVLGVPLAAVLADVAGWRFPFFAVGLLLLLAAAFLFLLVPRQRSQGARLDLLGRLRWVAAPPLTWRIASTNFLSRVAWGVIITFFPAFLIVTYKLGTADVAWPVAIVALWATAAPLLASWIGRGSKRLATVAVLLLSATLPGVILFHATGAIWLSVAIAGFFVLLILPVTTILAILFSETGGAYRGTLAGLISCTNWGGTAAGAAIGGVLVAQFGFGALSFLLAGVILVSGMIMAFLVNERTIVSAREHFSSSPPGTADVPPRQN